MGYAHVGGKVCCLAAGTVVLSVDGVYLCQRQAAGIIGQRILFAGDARYASLLRVCHSLRRCMGAGILCAALIGFLVYQGLSTRIMHYMFIALFAIGSIIFFYSADYVLNDVMEPHQRVRINVLLGLDDDLAGAGYNVHQSEIAIGSGGLKGKGFLNGTQTKAEVRS